MASANRAAFILDTVRAILATESTFDVRKVKTDDELAAGKTAAFAFIANEVRSVDYESGRITSGTTQVNVSFDVVKEADPQMTGTSSAKYADVLHKADAVFLVADTPMTNDDGVFLVTIDNIGIIAADGYADFGSEGVSFGIGVRVDWTMEPR